ncbi:class I SAM-dependent methyltransferase [Candidatus Bipolaricaulota bacterium]
MRDLWNGTYKSPKYWDDTATALIGLAELQQGSAVLDVGTGYGGTLFKALKQIGDTGRIVGIDVEAECVDWTKEEAKKRALSNAEILLMNARSMSFPDACFDAVIAGLVGIDEDYDFTTGKMIDGAPMFREILRVLKPGGHLYLSSWIWQEQLEWMGELVRPYVPDCDESGYFPATEAGYIDLLSVSGFDEILTEPFDEHYTFVDPASWMAVAKNSWAAEIAHIRALPPERLRQFEKDTFDLLAAHADNEGKLSYRISAVLVSAQKPIV